MVDVTFSDPQFLWLLVALPLFLFANLYSMKYVKKRAVRLANFEAMERVIGKVRVSFRFSLLLMRLLTLLFFLLSAAGLIFWYDGQSSDNSYVVAIDASGSMLATDMNPNRLEAAKQSALAFVDDLKGEPRVGVVSFSGIEEIDQVITSNRQDIVDAIKKVSVKSIHGTAIASSIRTSINLFEEETKPKVIILLTDGRENVAPLEKLTEVVLTAVQEHITIHTILVGTEQGGQLPQLDVISTADEELLVQIAGATGGKHFTVSSQQQLQQIYASIATSSEAQVPIKLRQPLLILGILFLFLEWTLLNTMFRYIP